jgi:hypothetical protein
LFDKIGNEKEEKDEKLRILLDLRKFKKENPDLFKQIKNMPARARVGRKSPVLKGATITFIRNEKRDAFLFVKENGELEELTFLQAEKEYNARLNEKAILLHSNHHKQVNAAVQFFIQKTEEDKQRERQVDVTQGPNEKKALSYLDAIINIQLANTEEKELLLSAKIAVRQGKFQQLQRDINKFAKTVKSTPLKPAVLLEELLKIVRRYPLQTIEENNQQSFILPYMAKKFNPEIIISESFDK